MLQLLCAHNSVGDTSKSKIALKKRSNNNKKQSVSRIAGKSSRGGGLLLVPLLHLSATAWLAVSCAFVIQIINYNTQYIT